MKKTILYLSVVSALWIGLSWFLDRAYLNWRWRRESVIQLNPQTSRDYNCIVITAWSARSFSVPWLSPGTPIQCFSIRRTSRESEDLDGIIYVDPRSLAYEAHTNCPPGPSALSGRLDTPQIILDWMASQPGSIRSASQTNEAREIFDAVGVIAPHDLEHFALPTNYTMKNFVIGRQDPAERRLPRFSDLITLALLWAYWITYAHQRSKAAGSPQRP